MPISESQQFLYFGPIAPGEQDSFDVEFATRLNGSSIASTSWTCAVAENTAGVDADPQAHVVATQIQGTKTVAVISGCVDGVTYVLNASVVTEDTPPRTLQQGAYLPCRKVE